MSWAPRCRPTSPTACADQRIAAECGRTLVRVPEGDHFLNACCVPALLGAMEQAIAEAEGAPLP